MRLIKLEIPDIEHLSIILVKPAPARVGAVGITLLVMLTHYLSVAGELILHLDLPESVKEEVRQLRVEESVRNPLAHLIKPLMAELYRTTGFSSAFMEILWWIWRFTGIVYDRELFILMRQSLGFRALLTGRGKWIKHNGARHD